MRKIIVLLMLLLAASIAISAQTKHKRKPSAAVRKHSTASSATTSHKTVKPAAQPATASNTNATTPAAPAAESFSAPDTSKNGAIYADEKGPLPVAPKTVTKKDAGLSPSDLPTGTAIRMKLQTPLSTQSSHEGDAFSGRVTEPVVIHGRTVIPVGASVTGRVLRVTDPRRIAGTGSLHMMPESVMLPNGQSYAINASMVDTSTPKKLTVDDEGRIKAKGVSSGDKAEMVAGTGVGAIVGTISAGGKGLLFGSMIGGGATVVHWLTKRHPVEVPAGTELIMEVSRPMTVSSEPIIAGE